MKLKNKLNVKYASLINNGTASLFCALKVLKLKTNDEAIIPHITFQATANSVINDKKMFSLKLTRKIY